MIAQDPRIQVLGTIFFGIAVLHTFLANPIMKLSKKFPKGSAREAVFHLLGEIEVVFGLWAFIFLTTTVFIKGLQPVIEYNEGVQFTEPLFVFCVMVMAATRPILQLANNFIFLIGQLIAKSLRLSEVHVDMFAILTIGPLVGSLITEPAAMTVTAILLFKMLNRPSETLLYAVLAILFVNVSIGGSLTHFAAPPILMVANSWNWDLNFVFSHFGYKSLLAVVINSFFLVLIFKKQIKEGCSPLREFRTASGIPAWVTGLHILFLVALVFAAHHPQTAFGIFLFFLGVQTVTKKYQDTLRLKESLLVAFFLGGIIVFGVFQRWWLEPLLSQMTETAMFYGAVALTAVTDNAALTYLGSQVSGLSESSKYFLVAGALAGGGLTIIANAPNAAGYSVLQNKFKNGLNPVYLLIAAIPATIVAVLCLEFLPHLQ